MPHCIQQLEGDTLLMENGGGPLLHERGAQPSRAHQLLLVAALKKSTCRRHALGHCSLDLSLDHSNVLVSFVRLGLVGLTCHEEDGSRLHGGDLEYILHRSLNLVQQVVEAVAQDTDAITFLNEANRSRLEHGLCCAGDMSKNCSAVVKYRNHRVPTAPGHQARRLVQLYRCETFGGAEY